MMSTRKIIGTLLPSLLLLLAGNMPLHAQTPDPGLPGTHAVLKDEYNLGDLAYTPPSTVFPYSLEVRGSVHYPADLASGPFPVLVWLHGRHETCYDSVTLATSSSWPCTGRRKPITSYAGYDYAARTMASHGYIVISVSANAINAKDGSVSSSFQKGMPARGYLVQHHLDLWNDWNTTATGPFGTLFNGKLDMQNIGTMGHSRGGEGVVFNAELNRSLGSPYGIKAVLTLAPVDFYRHVLNGIPFMNIAPYCDGDVSDLQGVHFYDDARYSDSTDEAPKHNILVMGANHNYFNTVWTQGSYIAGGGDDWLYSGDATSVYCGEGATGTGRLDSVQQKAVYNTYAAAFYRYYLGHDTAFAPILNVTDVIPPASSLVDSSRIFMSYHPGTSDRLDINRVDTVANLTVNNLGASVATTGITAPAICGGGLAMTDCDAGIAYEQKPHRGTALIKGLGQMRLKWTDTTGVCTNAIPAAFQDFSYTQSITFRACENFKESVSGPGPDCSVQLIDSAGNTSNLVTGNYTNALFYPPGTESGVLPKLAFNTIRVPVSGFTGINMSKVRQVNLRFNQSATGAILVSDLALVYSPGCHLSTSFTDTAGITNTVSFFNSSSTDNRDSLVWHWHFGDAASGAADSSLLTNPTHTYPGPGTYTACLYATSYRRNGLVCIDTFCTTVTILAPVAITSVAAEQEITIVPNPAKDFLNITGTGNNGTLTLINIYGQVVFSTAITQTNITLPQTLPAGVYNAVVNAGTRRVFKKIVIVR